MSAELERMLSNMVRIGRVKEVDHANARLKLEIGGIVTAWLPWGTARAGTTRTWSAPTVGEQRVLLSPYGDMSQGVVGPAIFQDDHAAPASSGDQEHVVFPDGSSVDYNSATNTLTVTVSEGGNVVLNCKHATINAENDATINTEQATINASESVMIDTPQTTCTGALTVQGLLTYQAGMTGSGGGTTATITGNMSVVGNIGLTGNMVASGTIVDGNGDGGA